MNLAGIKDIWRNKNKRKALLIGLLLAALYLVDIFYLSGILGWKFGAWGTVMHEVFLAASGVVVFLIFRGKLTVIYPFRKPELVKIAGTLVFWLGTYFITILVTGIIMYFFPEQVLGASEGVNDLVNSIPVLIGLLVVALTPAICEEMAFRGALLGCFRGSKKSQFIGLVLVSLFFGACHGSIWRMVPTALLGFAMGYILLETDNMCYNMLFHFVNNALPVLTLGLISMFSELAGGEDILDMAAGELASGASDLRLPAATIGTYLIYAGAAPMLLHIGNYLLHRGQPGYDRGVFPPEKKQQMVLMIGIGLGGFALGILLVVVSALIQTSGMLRSFY